MYPDISINELIKNGEKEQAAILVMDCLRQVINNGMPGVDLTRDEWLYVLPELVSQMQSARKYRYQCHGKNKRKAYETNCSFGKLRGAHNKPSLN